MMFRSTVNEDESGSDWDDLTEPQPGTSPSPRGASPGQQPAATSPDHAHYEHSSPHKLKGYPSSKKREPTQLPVNEPLASQDNFTAVATATTPRPHPPRTPAVSNAAYLVAGSGVPPQPSPPPTPPHSSLTVEPPGYQFSAISERSAAEMQLQHSSHKAYMERIAEKSERISQRCSAELFSTLRIITDWPIAFTLACLHFTLSHLLRKLLCGTAHILSDSLLKPSLQCCFNGLLWPLCSLQLQLSRACVLCCSPCLGCCGRALEHCAVLARACRLIHIDRDSVQRV